MADRKAFLLRIDPELYEVLRRWAAADLRSLNGQIEFVLRREATRAGRMRRRESPEAARDGPNPEDSPA